MLKKVDTFIEQYEKYSEKYIKFQNFVKNCIWQHSLVIGYCILIIGYSAVAACFTQIKFSGII